MENDYDKRDYNLNDGYYDNGYYDNRETNNTNNNIIESEVLPYLLLFIVGSSFIYNFCRVCKFRSDRVIVDNGSLIQDKNKDKIKEITKLNCKYSTLTLKKRKKNTECSICFDDYHETDNIIILNCSHIYHLKCIQDWFHENLNCPICRNSDLL